MNLDNFVVRPKRQVVEKYTTLQAWGALSDDARAELAHEVAGLPSELPVEPEEAKRFDLLMLNLQLALLRAEPAFARLRDQVKTIAGLLEEKAAIPMVRDQLELIEEVQTDEWWQDVTVPLLESARRRLRLLVRLIDKQERKPIYTDFEDQLGTEVVVALPQFADTLDFERFRAKARAFLREHQDHVAVHKLRMNRPLTPSDIGELERMFTENGLASDRELKHATQTAQGLGLFVRSLVGLDREAAKGALAGFLAGKTLTANQIEFVNLVIDHLTERGVVTPEMLYESPFTDVAPKGPEGLFTVGQVNELVTVLERIRDAAAAG